MKITVSVTMPIVAVMLKVLVLSSFCIVLCSRGVGVISLLMSALDSGKWVFESLLSVALGCRHCLLCTFSKYRVGVSVKSEDIA